MGHTERETLSDMLNRAGRLLQGLATDQDGFSKFNDMGRGNRRIYVLRIRDFEKPDIFWR